MSLMCYENSALHVTAFWALHFEIERLSKHDAVSEPESIFEKTLNYEKLYEAVPCAYQTF